jgi:hypothetical protein
MGMIVPDNACAKDVIDGIIYGKRGPANRAALSKREELR